MLIKLVQYEDMLTHYRQAPIPHKATLMSVKTSGGILIPLLFDTIPMPAFVAKVQSYMAEDSGSYKEMLIYTLKAAGYDTLPKLKELKESLVADVFTLFDIPMAIRTYELAEQVKRPGRAGLDILKN
jgi:hypothetical protein